MQAYPTLPVCLGHTANPAPIAQYSSAGYGPSSFLGLACRVRDVDRSSIVRRSSLLQANKSCVRSSRNPEGDLGSVSDRDWFSSPLGVA